MPNVGETCLGSELGYAHNGRRYIWVVCSTCGRERWIARDAYNKKGGRCISCANREKALGRRGEQAAHWKGKMRKDGYFLVKLYPDDFFYPMAGKDGYVRQHRLVMAKHLGRCLQRWENVHHKNGIKDDNRIENLELTGGIGEHSLEHSKGYRDGYARGLEDGRLKQIEELRKEIKLLQWQIKELIKNREGII